MEHLADELDAWWSIRVLLLEMHHEPERAIFKGSVCRADNDSVPDWSKGSSVDLNKRCRVLGSEHGTYHVMTLSAIGEADTPAGGSVCMRWRSR